jgi:hypothetical protein
VLPNVTSIYSSKMGKWHENLTADAGWNGSAFDGAEELTPSRNKILKTKFIQKNLICFSGGNVYVFLTSINCWSIMCSSQAVTFINSLMGMESASVRYGDAFGPYVEFLERHAVDNIAQPIPLSICIGTTRLRVAHRRTGLDLAPCESLIPSLPKIGYEIPSRLCYSSIAMRQWPPKWERTSSFPMYRFLSPLFEDPVDLLTVEWSIGNCLLDPHSFSKAVILYGEGGRGKGTFLGALKIMLMGCCGIIPDGALVSLSKGLPPSIASTVVSNRVVTAGDVGSTSDETNLAIIKTITGHDFIPIPPACARSACTLLYATNRLDDPLVNKEWATPAIMRRAIVINMTVVLPNGIEDTVPQDPTSRLDFALRCVHTRLTYQHMPVSPLSVVTTILGSKAEDAINYIAPINPEEADDEEVITANNIVAAYVGLTTDRVGQLAKQISPYAVCEIRSVSYIKGIVPSSNYEY